MCRTWRAGTPRIAESRRISHAAIVNHKVVNDGAKSAALKVKSRLMAQVFGLSAKRAWNRARTSVRGEQCIANRRVVETF
jgi:hypothetical protein